MLLFSRSAGIARVGVTLSALVIALGACSSSTTVPGGTGGATSSTTGSGGAGDGGRGGDPIGLSCGEYCATVDASCTGDFAVYASTVLCEGVCALLPLGTAADPSGNTIGCRHANAENAVTTAEPEVHCPIAGPGGDGVCGSNCEAYCGLLEQACPNRFNEVYDSRATCLSSCVTDIPDVGSYDVSMQQGDSIQCRLYHVTAATLDPGLHCSHAAGDAPCD